MEGSFEEKKDEPRKSGGVVLSKKPEGQTGTLQRLAPPLSWKRKFWLCEVGRAIAISFHTRLACDLPEQHNSDSDPELLLHYCNPSRPLPF